MDKDKKKELIFLLCIFFIAFTLRVSYCFFFKENILHIQTHIFGDTQDYIQIAKNFLSGEGLISSPDRIAYRPPLYPIFLSGVYFSFGDSYWPIRIIQSILDALTCIMVFFLGKNLIGRRTGETASAICAIYPFFIFFTGFELTETLFIFLLIGIVFLMLKLKDLSARKSMLAGIAGGLIILCKPSVLLFIFLSLTTLFFIYRGKNWRNIGLMIIFTILTISPWGIRNFYHFKKFVPLTTMAGRTFWEGNNPQATGGPCQYWPKEIQKLSETEQDKYLIEATFEVIKNNPFRFIKLLGKKFVRFWNITPNYRGFSIALYRIVSLFSYLPVLITAIWGMFLTRKTWKNFMLFYLLFASFTFMHMIFVGSIRYRVPIMPFMIIFSSYTLNWIFTKKISFLKK